MRELQNIMADRELSRAITALYLELDESIVNDLRSKADAALRRAKAEVWREAGKFSRDLASVVSGVGEHATAIELAQRFDARAAQIEEGE